LTNWLSHWVRRHAGARITGLGIGILIWLRWAEMWKTLQVCRHWA
jgi:hypothetical protein